MLSKNIQEALNNQIRNEFYSAYLYLSMASYCESINYRGFAKWLREQSKEELSHGMRLFDYVIDRNERAILESIAKPPAEFGSLLELFQQVLEHEKEVTSMINQIYELAINENDHATAVELQWFVKEQVEEEKTAQDIIDDLKKAGDNSAALLLLDNKYGSRGQEDQ